MKVLTWIAIVSTGCALAAYVAGLNARGPDCATPAGRRTLPLEQLCRHPDGSTYDLIPGWVNPVVLSALGVTLAAALAIGAAGMLRPRHS